jgi:hypothetical protein
MVRTAAALAIGKQAAVACTTIAISTGFPAIFHHSHFFLRKNLYRKIRYSSSQETYSSLEHRICRKFLWKFIRQRQENSQKIHNCFTGKDRSLRAAVSQSYVSFLHELRPKDVEANMELIINGVISLLGFINPKVCKKLPTPGNFADTFRRLATFSNLRNLYSPIRTRRKSRRICATNYGQNFSSTFTEKKCTRK